MNYWKSDYKKFRYGADYYSGAASPIVQLVASYISIPNVSPMLLLTLVTGMSSL